ncbi:MAG: nuclear transport factor 2 family protein [Gemmatimonadota bacterium]|nr:nuclear transport factor 2 family protein [Gemmatimonadota bacterium]
MHPHEVIIERFYTAFAARDGAAMAASYHRDLVFQDPVFGVLTAEQTGAMWTMLCARAPDLKVTVSKVRADDTSGSAAWDAWYTFSRSRRPVHNRISATFRFKDQRIIKHTDEFSFWRWSQQALGITGWLLGWTPWLRRRVQREAHAGLVSYMQRQSPSGSV